MKSVCMYLLVVVWLLRAPMVMSITEAERRAMTEKWDRKNLRYATGTVTDSSQKFLKIPKEYAGKHELLVAKETPIIDFAPVRVQ